MKRFFRQFGLARAIARTGFGSTDRLTLFLWSAYAYFADALSLPPIAIKPTIRIFDAKYRVLLETLSDLWVFKDVLVDREYDLPDLPEVSTVVDLGCNIGISSLFFAARFPYARIYALEPNPAIAAQLRTNASAAPNIVVHELALADADGSVRFTTTGRAISGAVVSGAAEGVVVNAVASENLKGVLGIEQIGLLKFDIEGAERHLFPEGISALAPHVALGEMHYDLSGTTPEKIRENLAGYDIQERFIRGSERSIIYMCARAQ